MARRKRRSRLARKEGSRLMRQTVLLFILTIVILFAIIYWGIPALIKMAVFLGDLRNSTVPIGQEDVIAPSPPQLIQLPQATSSARIVIRGYSESGALVSLYNSGSLVKETTTDGDGDFSFVDIMLKNGENKLYAMAKDEAGNESDQSKRLTIVFDADVPSLEVTTPKDKETIYGQTKRTITVTGITEAGVSVTVNGRFAYVDAEGTFSTTIQLDEGDNKITVIAEDRASNQAQVELSVKYSP